MNSPVKYIALIVAALLLIAGAVFYYVSIYIPGKETQLTMTSIKNSKPAVDALYTGQYDEAEDSLRSLIQQAPSKSEQARLQELLMATLFDSGSPAKMTEAASIAYNLVNDYSVPAWIRAMTYNTLSRVVYAHIRDISFYKTYLNKAPFDSYLGTSGSDEARMWSAYLALLKTSDEIYPTSLAEYALASYYFGVLLNTSPDQQTQEELAKLIRRYVAEGDSRNDKVSQAPGALLSLYAPYTLILNQLFRAKSLAISNKVLKDQSWEEVEEAYTKVKITADYLETTGVDMSNPKIQAVLLTWRFAYADFLLTFSGASRTDDIKALLAPFGAPISKETISFLEHDMLASIKNSSSPSVTRTKALKLAAISPEFKTFLKNEGVSF